jgi:hypothetical protein
VIAVMLGVLGAAAPFAAVLALLAWAQRRERRRHEVQARQIVLTEAIHERLGAIAAPVVRRRRGRWHVCLAVPFERPVVVEALLAIVRETFAPRDRRSLEIVLTRQPNTPAPRRAADGAARRRALSWT